MNVFEFLLALYVIIAGLGLSLLVRSIGQMIEHRNQLQLYWVHSVWLLLIFVMHVITWYALWRFHAHSPWTLLEVLLLLCMPILLYLVSHLAVPELSGEGRNDMREYYERHSTWMHGLMLGVVLSGSLAQIGIEGRPDVSGGGQMRIVAAVALLIGTVSRRPVIQGTVAVALVIMIALAATTLLEPIADS
jgi:hypothetical protein